MNDRSYFASAGRLVLRDHAIWWTVAALSAIQLVPILGYITVTGYMMVLMRDVAWNVDRGLPRLSEFVEFMKRGFSGLVISVVWMLPVLVVMFVLALVWMGSSMPAFVDGGPEPALPWWWSSLISGLALFLMPLIYGAWLRAAIYLQTSAGLSISGLRRLIGLDRSGFWRVAGLALAVGAFGTLIGVAGNWIVLDPRLPAYLVAVAPYVFGFLTGLVMVPLNLIVASAYGAWARETEPGSWPPLWSGPDATLAGVRGQNPVGEDPL